VQVHPASVPDREGGRVLIEEVAARYPSLEKLWADAGYRGPLVPWATEAHDLTLEVVHRSPDQEPATDAPFPITPHRWVVERSFAWLGRYRRMSKDYEALCASQRTNVHLCMIFLMLHRLAP
jgi:putative transposase